MSTVFISAIIHVSCKIAMQIYNNDVILRPGMALVLELRFDLVSHAKALRICFDRIYRIDWISNL